MGIQRAIAVVLVAGMRMALLAQVGTATPAVKPAYSLTVRAAQSEVQVGKPINVDITLTNISEKALSIAFERGGHNEFIYLIVVADQQGVEAPYTPYFRAVMGRRREPGDPDTDTGFSTRLLTVQPSKSVTTQTDITLLYRLEAPGTYTVRVERFDKSSGIRVKSNTVDLTVTP